jgi:hypothetical protein
MIKAVIEFIKAMRFAFPSCAKKAAADKLNSCGALPTPDDIVLGGSWKTSHWGPNGGRGFHQSYTNLKSGKSNEKFFPGSDSNYTCQELQSKIANGIGNSMIDKATEELKQSGPARTAKWLAGAGSAAAVASALTGCESGGPTDREQEFYDAFDAAQLEGDMDPVATLERAMRQAQRNQQNGSCGCGCNYSLVEAGAGVNYGDSCKPPNKFKPPGYTYPGYMELRKNCGGNDPSTTSSRSLDILLDSLE